MLVHLHHILDTNVKVKSQVKVQRHSRMVKSNNKPSAASGIYDQITMEI